MALTIIVVLSFTVENLQLVTAAKILSHSLFSKHQKANKSDIRNGISKIPQLSTISKRDESANNNNPTAITQTSMSDNNNMLSTTANSNNNNINDNGATDNKVVMFTFGDIDKSQSLNAKPILDQYGFKGRVFCYM